MLPRIAEQGPALMAEEMPKYTVEPPSAVPLVPACGTTLPVCHALVEAEEVQDTVVIKRAASTALKRLKGASVEDCGQGTITLRLADGDRTQLPVDQL